MPISKRFFHPAKNFTVGALLDILKAEDLLCDGSASADIDNEVLIEDISGLDDSQKADGGRLIYAESAKAIEGALKMQGVGLLLVPQKLYDSSYKNAVAVKHAEYAFAVLARAFYPVAAPHVASDAASDNSDSHPSSLQLGLGVKIGTGVKIGEHVRIGDYSIIGDGCIIGDYTDIGSHCSIRATQMGKACRILSGSMIGDRGFGYAIFADHPPLSLPHIGGVVLEDYVEIGNNCTIDRGKFTDTHIGAHVKFDNMVHIAHNVNIGSATMISAQVGIAGSVTIGSGVMIGGKTAVAPAVTVGDGVTILPCSAVHADVADGMRIVGVPAHDAREFGRAWATLKRLAKERKGDER